MIWKTMLVVLVLLIPGGSLMILALAAAKALGVGKGKLLPNGLAAAPPQG